MLEEIWSVTTNDAMYLYHFDWQTRSLIRYKEDIYIYELMITRGSW